MNEIYRPEAIESARRRLSGSVMISTPVSTKLLTAAIAVLVLGVGALLCFSTYSRKESIQGLLVPTGGLIDVVSAQGGVVTTIHVLEGQTVPRGTVLMTLRTTTDLKTGSVADAIGQSLQREAAARTAELAAKRRQFEVDGIKLARDQALLSREVAQARDRVQALMQKQALARESVARAEEVAAKGFLSAQSLQSRKIELLSVAEDLSVARSNELGLQRQLNDILAQKRAGDTELAREVALAEGAQAALVERSILAKSSGTNVAVMPVPGEVLVVTPRRGAHVQPGDTVAVVAPAGGDLIAELQAPARVSGFLRIGQDVRLGYTPFPRERFGTVVGVIEAISKAPLPTPPAAPNDEKASAEPTVRVRVRLPKQNVRAYGRDMPLKPGTPVAADVVVDRRTLVEWLLDPLYAAGRLH